jgi:hypothetical protein
MGIGLSLPVLFKSPLDRRTQSFRDQMRTSGVRGLEFEKLVVAIDVQRMHGASFGIKELLDRLGAPDTAWRGERSIRIAYGMVDETGRPRTVVLSVDHRDRLHMIDYFPLRRPTELGNEYVRWEPTEQAPTFPRVP